MQREDACHLSTSWSRVCQLDESNAMRCETLKQTFRHCSGKPPELVREERTQDDGADLHGSPFGSDSPLSASPWAIFGRDASPPLHPNDSFGFGPFQLFRRMDELFGLPHPPPSQATPQPRQHGQVPMRVRVDQV